MEINAARPASERWVASQAAAAAEPVPAAEQVTLHAAPVQEAAAAPHVTLRFVRLHGKLSLRLPLSSIWQHILSHSCILQSLKQSISGSWWYDSEILRRVASM